LINQDKNTSFRFLDELTNSGLFNTEEQVIENYDVLVDYVRDWLESNEYDTAMACFELLLEKKNGKLRGDGKSPSALHEISQAIYTISLIEDGVGLADPESVIALNFLHDLGEEYGVKAPKLMEQFKKFNCSIGGQRLTILLRDFDLITKQYKGEPPKYKSEWEYYLPMQQSENVSVAKLIDRLHNIATIVGVKDSLRCREYITNAR